MKIGMINMINPIGFAGKIIDSHVHTGEFFNKNYGVNDLDVFVKSPLTVDVQGKKQEDTVEKMLISNLSGMNGEKSVDETQANLEMLEICAKNDKFIPVAVCEPNKTMGNTDAMREILDDNDFVALKFHPEGNGLRANDEFYDPYLDMAEEKGLPCIFHSQVNLKWQPDENDNWHATVVEDKKDWQNSDPEFIYELAKRHPNVPVVLAHTGAGGDIQAHNKAIDVMMQSVENNDAKLYCDISWVDFKDGIPDDESKSLVNLITKLKDHDALDRVMFGTDAPLGCYGEVKRDDYNPKQAYEKTVSTFKTVIKDNFDDEADDIIQKVFYDNANKLFFTKSENN